MMMDGFCLVETVTTKNLKNPRQLLTPMALDFSADAVTAVLGPSGSGKTTLLSVITDSIQTNVTCRAKVHLPGVSSFVPQDDRLHGFYTVQTYVTCRAKLHLPGISFFVPQDDRLRGFRAVAGRRVILTIHQPSSFIWQTIDHVI
jgi:ABC-type multidrug transport system ATPase subunit